MVPGFNKAVQIGRTVINFSVKNLNQQKNQAFGPKPLEGPIKEKMDEIVGGAKLGETAAIPQMEQESAPFDMAPGECEENKDDIPEEIPESRKTGGANFQ